MAKRQLQKKTTILERSASWPGAVIRASSELTIITGIASFDAILGDRLGLIYDQARLRLVLASELTCEASPSRILLLVCMRAFRRLGGQAIGPQDRLGYHLPPQCRAIASAITTPLAGLSEAACETYRAAKAVELLCETLQLLQHGALVPLTPIGNLSLCDSQRIIAARELIGQRCGDKLTLNAIARECGINRAKLTRGFRDMFACTIAEAIADQRLTQAGRLLLTTDMPVGCIGHESGFLNNASFARAFGRHFGLSPSRYRAAGA